MGGEYKYIYIYIYIMSVAIVAQVDASLMLRLGGHAACFGKEGAAGFLF